ncbi:hypothetical protein PPYR_09876 [Photinus pyralis]|uniref:MADF domain-containing protein n=1 Tax=Photinus pyralis TaxID=7054 RepID=A0A1Y1LV87_PHOPY|nr:uncharacterized protein LOC116173752 [Photinus pyralis]KAB0795815.1 hypothetical protein PPYR_09876 [Photinus pyralis]
MYKIKSANYKNRNLRKKALDAIQSELIKIKPDVTIQKIQNKFQSLKQNANKEFKKCNNSKRSGADQDAVIEPSLWYYEMLRFIFDNCSQREALDSFDEIESQDDVVMSDDDEMQEYVIEEVLQ